MEDYSFDHKIGAGAQGEVYQVHHNQSKKEYAMKMICCSDHEQVNAALKEIKVLLQLRHTSIVSYVDFFLVFNNAKTRNEFAFSAGGQTPLTEKDSLLLSVQKKNGQQPPPGHEKTKGAGGSQWLGDEEIAVCLVMELCNKGDMQGLIRDSRQTMMESGKHPISEAQVLSWMEQSVRALDFIHGKGFLHRDLKPTNIFFDSFRDAKIGDFGLAATVGLGRHSAVGTPFYLAPERMLEECYDGKVDVWGLGVVMLELLTLRERPINSLVLSDANTPDKMVPEMTKMGFSAKLAALIRDMIQRFPEGRPSTAAILQRLSTMTASSPHLGMSSSLFAGMSCPKLDDVLCDNCEVEMAQVVCPVCRTTLCDACDRAKHKHHSRQSHERTSLSNFTANSTLQQTLSSARTSPAFSDHRSVSMFPSPTNSSQGSRQTSLETGKGYNRLQMAAFQHGNSLSMSDFSISVRRAESSSLFAGDPIVRIPQDYPDLATALRMLPNLPHIRKVILGANTVQSIPVVLTDALPDNLKIVGETPSPVIEVSDTAFAVHFSSGRGVLENVIIRHVGRCRAGLTNAAHINRNPSPTAEESSKDKKAPRPSAVSITGGEWRLHRCRISCVDGCGVTVGGGRRTDTALRSPSAGRARSTSSGGSAGTRDPEDSEMKPLEPVITKCTFIDITTAGVVVNEKARGLYEGNTFSGCGYAAFLLKKECEPTIRANHITDGAETGIFCQDGCGTIEHNLIAQNAGCGVVIKGALAAPVFRKNRVLNNSQAGFFCCDRCSPFISDNEVKQNQKAGILIKTQASPKVTKNVIEGGKEAGVYVFEGGAGIIEENTIRGNMNAGLLVTTRGKPHVIHNVLTANAYEGIWVCKEGGGTFCDNDLRGNVKGPMDLDKACTVTWIGNTEH